MILLRLLPFLKLVQVHELSAFRKLHTRRFSPFFDLMVNEVLLLTDFELVALIDVNKQCTHANLTGRLISQFGQYGADIEKVLADGRSIIEQTVID